MHLVSKYFYPFSSSSYQQIDLTPITVQVNALMLFENHKREFSVTAEGRLIDVHKLSSKDKIAYKIYQYFYPEEMTKIINHVVKETLSAIHQLNQQSISNQEKKYIYVWNNNTLGKSYPAYHLNKILEDKKFNQPAIIERIRLLEEHKSTYPQIAPANSSHFKQRPDLYYAYVAQIGYRSKEADIQWAIKYYVDDEETANKICSEKDIPILENEDLKTIEEVKQEERIGRFGDFIPSYFNFLSNLG